MDIINNFNKIKQQIKNNSSQEVQIIAVSKTFSLDHIMPLIKYGHNHFGENKVQEAEKKWSEIKMKNKELKLHMIGRLQSNKAKKAVELFDFIHSLDSEKLANELSKREKAIKRELNYFIQVNLGSEEQKGGVEVSDLKDFYNHCKNKLNLSILGLMAIPPNDGDPEKHFQKIFNLNKDIGLKRLSIGMSNDYIKALRYEASYVRVGSAIFGKRN